jgi:hypothetical protein
VDLPFEAVARLLGFLSNAKSREKSNVFTKWLDYYFPQDRTDDIFLLYRMLMPKVNARSLHGGATALGAQTSLRVALPNPALRASAHHWANPRSCCMP